MTYPFAYLLLLLTFSPALFADEPIVKVPLGVALFSPLDTDPRQTRVTHYFELNVIYGRAYALEGMAVGIGVNRTDGMVTGAQISAVANSSADVQGGQISSLYNHTMRDLTGIQMTAAYNNIGGNLTGTQLAAYYNFTQGAVLGAQLAVYNDTAGSLTGVQLGLVNRAKRMKFALQEGFVNIADDVMGVQWGAVNIADEVVGAQVGLVNISSHNKYGQFGMVNIDTSNFFNLYSGSGNNCAGIFGLRSGSKWLFGDVGLTMMSDDDSKGNYLHVVNGLGLQTSLGLFHFSLEALGTPYNTTKIFFLMAGASFPVWDKFEGFVQAGPRIDHIFAYRGLDTLAGIQFRLRDALKE